MDFAGLAQRILPSRLVGNAELPSDDGESGVSRPQPRAGDERSGQQVHVDPADTAPIQATIWCEGDDFAVSPFRIAGTLVPFG